MVKATLTEAIPNQPTTATSGQTAEGAAGGAAPATSKSTGQRRLSVLQEPEALACAGGIVIGWQAAQAEIQLRRFTEVWQRLEKSPPFWKGKT
ncbi:hypothetical protein [Halorhodospira halochloris]|uniref:hypothetical protein n=1 Tax=Halorhodospira halochloris TaxID=1052 RepID=UPI001EE9313B|nr:hypothetical protein [Halorhodospira halochloris]MCG5548396.1 hypothetical protein [Halorhodospira halochloris]